MKLIVGLGNPGRKFEGTRHNVGYLVLDELAAKHAVGRRKNNFQGETVEARLGAEPCLLLWPQTMMNLSGASVLAGRDFYKLTDEELLIVCDDFNLPLAKLRIRAAGSAGGQRGLENIIQRLGTDQIPRLRVGIGPVRPGLDPADFVLSRFRKDEWTEMQPAVWRAADAALVWGSEGIEACMNRFN